MSLKTFWILVVLDFITSATAGVLGRAQAPSATLTGGQTFVGLATNVPSSPITVNSYLGIPYGSPPERFKPAVAASNLASPYHATAYGPACIQQIPSALSAGFVQTFLSPEGVLAAQSEDCLSLNIWTPTGGSANKTVMFYLHGGALISGYSGQEYLDGTSFAANQDVVIVTVNYRLNVFGFSGSPQVPIYENNVGFLDQRLALQWVQDNIAAFGGDPTKVTIFGQSSGAASVDRMLLTMDIDPPFRAAILQSGQATVSPIDSMNDWSQLVIQAGCNSSGTDQLACVQALPWQTIQNITQGSLLLFEPQNDGITQLPTPRTYARSTRQASNVPLLLGSLGQEGTVFVELILSALGLGSFGSSSLSANQSESLLSALTNETSILDSLVQKLVATGEYTVFDATAEVLTLYINQCPISITGTASATASVPTWRYYFDAAFNNTQPPIAGEPYLGAYHTSDIAIVWGNYPSEGATKQEVALSAFVQTAWANFAKDPYGDGPGWERLGRVNSQLACLGCNGGTGATLVSATVLDVNCAVLAPAYALFTSIGI